MKLPTRSLAFLIGGLMVGTALAPVGAQQIAPADGQVAVRSDGAVYLIINAQRRWVPTVQITDEELNAYPEGEPIYAGLAPMGSQTGTTTARVTGSPTTGAPTFAGTTSASTTPTTVTSTTGTTGATGTTAGATATTGALVPGTALASNISPDLPLEVDIEGQAKFEPDERIIVYVKTKTGAACELAVKWPDGNEVNQAPMTADSNGRCRYSIEIAATATPGAGILKGVVRDGGRVSSQDVEFEIVPTS